MGFLLRTESELAGDIARARAEFVQKGVQPQRLPGFGSEVEQGELDFSGIDEDAFFAEAESRLLDALARYATEVAGRAGARRRLFADDSAHGVAWLELVRQRFDVVLMNPPFGAGSLKAKEVFDQSYPRTRNDLYAAFVERGVELLEPSGMLGAITSRTGFFISSFQKWREEIILDEAPPLVFADLGQGVLDGAMVEVAAYCLEKSHERKGLRKLPTAKLRIDDFGKTEMRSNHYIRFFGVINTSDKAQALRSWNDNSSIYRVACHDLASIPKSPFAYWLSEQIRLMFRSFDTFGSLGGVSKQGVATGDNARFLRAWWEVPTGASMWKHFVNGGVLSPFYMDPLQVLDYSRAGQIGIQKSGRYGRGATHYYRPGLTWAVRSSRFAPAPMPGGCIFSHRGFTAFAPDRQHLAWCGLFNSRIFDFLYKANLGRFAFPNYEMGVLPRIPVPPKEFVVQSELGTLALRAWSLRRLLDTVSEVSHSFELPALLQVGGEAWGDRVSAWATRVAEIEVELAAVQNKIEEVCFGLYRISDEDRRSITEGFGVADVDEDTAPHDEEADVADEAATLDPQRLAAQFVSWAVGVGVGRFDVRLATGVRESPRRAGSVRPAPGVLTQHVDWR